MAQILEYGKYRTAICSCGCKFTFKPYEIDANKQIKCPDCDEFVTVLVKEQHNTGSDLQHGVVIDEAKAPTCTESGLTEGSHCSMCNKIIIAQEEIPPLGHSYNATVTAPTCIGKGYTTHTCSTCGDSYITDEVAALGHNWVDATCIAPKTCSGCGLTKGETVDHMIDDDGICTVCKVNFKKTITLMSDDSEYATISGLVGDEVPELPVPEKANYYFGGWHTDEDYTNRFIENTFSENLTLYAKWFASDTSGKISIMSMNADKSDALASSGKVKKAIAAAGNPDIICLQNLGKNWFSPPTGYTNTIDGYTASLQNTNSANTILDAEGKVAVVKYFIYYNNNKFNAIASNLSNYYSYIILERAEDKALFAIINTWFDNSDADTKQAELQVMWERINGIWNDSNRGLIPIIITGSLTATPDNSNVYQSLTESSLFVDASNVAKSSTGSARDGDYIFASYQVQYMVESYEASNEVAKVEVAIPSC